MLLARKPITSALFVLALASCAAAAADGPATRPATQPVRKAFFTVDGGRTFFADDAAKVPPFDHAGRRAYRCQVYRCPNGKPFVNHMESFSPQDKRRIEEEMAKAAREPGGNPLLVLARNADRIQVCRPGQNRWVALTAETAQAYADVIEARSKDCPREKLERVRPE